MDIDRTGSARGRAIATATAIIGASFVALLLDHAVRAAPATNKVSVIELFTSQGCPKCPPADKLIGEFAKAPNTIALSYAVNYWDYIGWKDTLASPVFTARQHAYAAARRDHEIYTPQVIVDGVDAEPGTDKIAILRDASTRMKQRTSAATPISMTESAGRLHIEVGAGAGDGKRDSASIYVLRVARQKTIQIDRGDNSGQRVTYTNVVRAMDRIGDWTGQPKVFDILDLKGDDDGFVVILQSGTADKPGPVIAAAKSSGL